jgi:signal transduction histidine kinase
MNRWIGAASRFGDRIFSGETDSAPAIVSLSLAILAIVFVVDLVTPQTLIVSILLNVSIAMTGLLASLRTSIAMVVLCLLANGVAGTIDARHEGFVSAIAVWDRIFSGFSYVLVWGLSRVIRQNAIRSGQLIAVQARSHREHLIRKSLGELVARTEIPDLIRVAAEQFRVMCRAKAVVVKGVAADRFSEPTVHVPDTGMWSWPSEDPIPGGLKLKIDRPDPAPFWATQLSFRPFADRNRSDRVAAGWVRLVPEAVFPPRPTSIVFFVIDPEEDETLSLLAELLPFLEEMLNRSVLTKNLKEKNLTLRMRNDVIRDLVYAVSHDIRTPLVANTLNMKMAKEGAWGELPDAYRTILDHATASNDALLKLANDLLLLTRYELNEVPAVRIPLDLSALARGVVEELGPLFGAKSLTPVVCGDPVLVTGDPGGLKRLILNLLDNAIRWSPDDGTVRAALETREGRILLEIADEGAGVAPEVRPHLFKRFGGFQKGGGAGLGLYISNQIARQHGGTLSYRFDRGSHFVLSIPSTGDLQRAVIDGDES